jgi:nitroreductase
LVFVRSFFYLYLSYLLHGYKKVPYLQSPLMEFIIITEKEKYKVGENKMNEVIKNIISRRSIRKFQSRQIEEDTLNEILLAGAYGPSAGGRQSPVFAVCQNQQINEELGKINFEILKQIMDKRPPMDPKAKTQEKPKAMDFSSVNSAFQGAPTVITLFAPKDWYNFTIDCAVSAENMMLAANSLGIASCMIARAQETFETDFGKKLKAEWGIDDIYEAKIHVILGYQDGETPEPKPRKDDRIIRIK